MSIVWPERSLPPADAPRAPAADVVFFRVLREHPALDGVTVELAHEPSKRTSPWVRTSVVRYTEAHELGESTPVAGLDVYADDALVAADLAARIAAVWPFIKRTTVPGEGYVSGAWVEVEPYRIDEPAESSSAAPLARYHLEVGLRLHPVP